jgi:hypothetical protein
MANTLLESRSGRAGFKDKAEAAVFCRVHRGEKYTGIRRTLERMADHRLFGTNNLKKEAV